MIEHIFLIGYRAAGKTTIGKPLADRLGFEFLDTDQLICRNRSCQIHDIVAAEGWDGFRKYEFEALVEAAEGRNRVVATGGGAILHRQFWKSIGDTSFVVWLSADLATLVERLKLSVSENTARPSLTGKAIHAEIEDVLAERTPLYRKCADLEVDTGKVGTIEAVDIIIDTYRRRYCGSNA